jgi:hypothetical protein
MKKTKFILLTTITLFILSVANVNAKNGEIFGVGDNNLNIQLGVGNTWYYDTYYHTSLPQVSVSFDHGLRDDWGPGIFGIGAFMSVATYKYTYYTHDDYRITDFNIAGRATYHYQFFDKVDTYGGVIAGLNIRRDNIDSSYDGEEGVYPMGSVFAGIKYYFNDKISVMSELYAYDVAFFNIGFGFKF